MFDLAFLLQSFLACDRDFPCTELIIPDADQLVSWDEGEILNVISKLVFALGLQNIVS